MPVPDPPLLYDFLLNHVPGEWCSLIAYVAVSAFAKSTFMNIFALCIIVSYSRGCRKLSKHSRGCRSRGCLEVEDKENFNNYYKRYPFGNRPLYTFSYEKV